MNNKKKCFLFFHDWTGWETVHKDIHGYRYQRHVIVQTRQCKQCGKMQNRKTETSEF